MEKPISLITGATEGVGKATAAELARKGFAVILAARNAGEAEMVINEIAASTGNSDLDYIIGDLTSLTQIRQLSETFKQRYVPARVMTEDGYETTFQVNYLSQFHLTHLLLDELTKSRQGRIINLSSSVYRVGKFDEDNLQSERRFSAFGSYSASKLLVLLFTIELANRLKGTRVTANAVHPGVVRTQMMFDAPGALRAISYVAAVLRFPATRRHHIRLSRVLPRGAGCLWEIFHAQQDAGREDQIQFTRQSEFVVGPQHEVPNSRGSEVAEEQRWSSFTVTLDPAAVRLHPPRQAAV